MRSLLQMLVCLFGLLGLLTLTTLLTRITAAEAPYATAATGGSGAQNNHSAYAGTGTARGDGNGNSNDNGIDRGDGRGIWQPDVSPTPTVCTVEYTYTVSTGTVVAATNVITSCYQCITPVSLPFPFTFYGQNYASAQIGSTGNIQFDTSDNSYPSCPFPMPQLGPSILPYWAPFEARWSGSGSGPCLATYGMPCGIYTAVRGSAPDRIFDIQWVGVLIGSNHETVNFEARLHERTGVIDFVYANGAMVGSYGAVGVQDGTGAFASYACQTSANLQGLDLRWTPSGGPCTPNTPTLTRTSTDTPTRTPSPTLTDTPTSTPTVSCEVAWRVVSSDNVGYDNFLYGVAAISPNDVWTVGSSGNPSYPFLQHWNGTQWALASPTPLVGSYETLFSVDAVTGSDVWAVGTYNTSAANTLTLHWDGDIWSWIQSPNGTGTQNQLTSVSALAANDVWAVGYQTNGTYVSHPLIEHWNGTIWSVIAGPEVNGNGYLRGVEALAADNVWAVGNYIQDQATQIAQPFLLHWNGIEWNVVSGPPLTWGGRLQAVAAVSSNDIWAAGAYASTSAGYDDRTLTIHWDGTSWSTVPSPSISSYETHLWGMAARASNDVWAVGTYNTPGAQQSVAMHWDGVIWTLHSPPDPNPNPSPSATPSSNNLFGVAIAAPGDVWAVGSYDDSGRYLSLTAHYSASGCETATPAPTATITTTPTHTATSTPTSSCPAVWITVPSQQGGNGNNYLAAVDAASSNDIWAAGRVGINLSGILEHWDGSHWSNVSYQAEGFADKLNALSVLTANDAWMVGWYEGSASGTLIEHWNGTQWTYVQSPNGGGGTWSELMAVSARTSSDIWAVGTTDGFGGPSARPLVLHGNGIGWAVVGSPTVNGYLTGVWALAADDVWAVGNYFDGNMTKPMIEHWDGTVWTMSPIPVFTGTSALLGVVGISATDVWAVGNALYQTLTMHWDGAAWSIVPSPNVGSQPNYLYGSDARASNDVWAVGKYVSSGVEQTLTMHWDGAAWSIMPSPSPNSGAAYQAVSMIASNEVWAVGYTDVGGAIHTLTARYAPTGQCGGSTPTATATATLTATAIFTSSTDTPTTTRSPVITATGGAGNTSTSTAAVVTSIQTSTPAATGTMSTPTACAIRFIDVPESSTFFDFVRCLVCRGIISGYSDGTFKPGSDVTRGQLAKIVSNAAGLNDPAETQYFEDVPPGSTFFDNVGRLASRGIMSGYPCGGPEDPCVSPGNLPYFRPSRSATRGQISKIVSNAAGLSEPQGVQLFEDVAQGSTFYDYVQRLANRDVMSGYPCGDVGEPCGNSNRPYFRPNNHATRGQSAKIVSNTFFPGCRTPD